VRVLACVLALAAALCVGGARSATLQPVTLKVSADGHWRFYYVPPSAGGSSSIADGTELRVAPVSGGPSRSLGTVLPYRDYLSWCDGALVFAAGGDRIAIHGKQLLVARPPDWRPRPLWPDRARSFASPACQPHHAAVAVLTQRSSTNARFFATRWRLWLVALDGRRRLVDRPPPGWADEQPVWSPDGGSLLFVRERNGYGRVMLRTHGRLVGPLRKLGYRLGYYGHHDWGLRWPP